METPPGFAEYPRPKGQPSGVIARPPGLHFEALSDAWALFAREWTTWVAAQLLICILAIAIMAPFFFLGLYLQYGTLDLFQPRTAAPSPAGVMLNWVVLLAPTLVSSGFQAGLVSMAVRQVRGQQISLGDAFGSFRHAPKLLLISTCVSLPSALLNAAFGPLVGLLANLGLGLVLYPLLALSPFVAVDQNISGRAAIGLCIRALGGLSGWAGMLLLLIVMLLIYICGILACGVGVLAAVPVCILMLAVHYYYYFPEAFESSAKAAPYG